jgi:hypothetical protein
MLTRMGCNVSTAENGEQALNMIIRVDGEASVLHRMDEPRQSQTTGILGQSDACDAGLQSYETLDSMNL